MVTNRKKGHDFEREIANTFRLCGWTGAKRHLEFQQAECMGFDLDGTDPFRIQCKALANYVPINTIDEIHPSPAHTPLLITKADGKPAMAVLPLADFMRIITALKRQENQDLRRATSEDF